MVSLSFNEDPCLAEILCENIAIHLYKRVGIAGRGGHSASERSTIVSSAVLRKNSGWAEGVVVIKGSIRAGDAGAECSWSIPDYAYVKVSTLCIALFFHRVRCKLTPLLLVRATRVITTSCKFIEPRPNFRSRRRVWRLHQQLGCSRQGVGVGGWKDHTCSGLVGVCEEDILTRCYLMDILPYTIPCFIFVSYCSS
jgi:hypothetical protein